MRGVAGQNRIKQAGRSCSCLAIAAGMLALLLVRGAGIGSSQAYPTMGPATGRPHLNDGMNGNPLDDEKVLKALNADRQKSMISDTNKLVRLVNELDAEIEKSNVDSLTDEQRRKIAEIEKLAHNVKEKMSTSVRGTMPYRPPGAHVQ